MQKQELTSGVTANYIKNERFKTTLISISFFMPLNEEFAPLGALISKLMTAQSERYKNLREINAGLDMLYGAVLSSSIEKTGDKQEIRFAISTLSSDYVSEQNDTLLSSAEFLCELIFSKHINRTEYSNDVIELQKRILAEEIEAQINDKRQYARIKAENIMCEGEPFGLSELSSAEKIFGICNSDIMDAIEKLFKTSFVNINVIGKTDPTEVFALFSSYFSKIERCYKSLPQEIVKKAGEKKTVVEEMAVSQGKLVIGFRTDEVGEDIDSAAALVMCDLFGGGPYSKLFKNVREKLSLCYYCAARPVRKKGLIFVESGVEKANTQKAESEILNQFEMLKNGDFSDEELEFSLKALCDRVGSVSDDLLSIDRWYAVRCFEERTTSPDEYLKELKKVDRDAVVLSANTFNQDTVYIIDPKEGEENE
ncbi:MAG: insulinase family protein [Oscillospiraceae bacterium]